ncbi:nicotinate-nucleotide--dimethylbenzimidazole phosphoribosyltransferase [Halorussus marinus]|uniref:nicotinate-nucleotide--dimethylbenzimidazole phosphoribosyltransferase n=1 Tax=Halorussus marinus TaxID=2505976 RepID=UPI00109255BC|nr:TIGR00303 family protein [Halorussus marinus]
MRFVLVSGATRTAEIDGISAAGADPALMAHTPSADAEIVEYGRPVDAPVVPVSPTGCPTPAVVTRAVRERLGFETLIVDAGLAAPTGAPTVEVGSGPGGDVREPEPVADASETFAAARDLGASLPDEELVVAETVPGGTTTALGVLSALGERASVSSSLPDNPMGLKREVVADALAASDLSAGDCRGDPRGAVRRMGDPVLAAVAGLTRGALDAGTDVTLAGGTQLAAAGALVRHAGIEAPLELATTRFVADDDTAAIGALADDLDLSLTVTDPEFEAGDHPATDAYLAGEAKEGVGMGGALALADRAGASPAAIREQIGVVYDRITGDGRPGEGRDADPDDDPREAGP